MNLSQALAAFVGQNIGANKFERVKIRFEGYSPYGGWHIRNIFADNNRIESPLMKLFTPDPDVVMIGSKYCLLLVLSI